MGDRKIAKACGVSHPPVADVRLSLTGNSSSETPAARTYTTKNGTQATTQTTKAGKGGTLLRCRQSQPSVSRRGARAFKRASA